MFSDTLISLFTVNDFCSISAAFTIEIPPTVTTPEIILKHSTIERYLLTFFLFFNTIMTAKLAMQIDTTKNTAILFPVLTDSSLFTLLFCVAKTLFLLTPSVAEVTACTSGIKIFVVSSIFDFEVAVAFVLSGLVAVLFTFIATISRVILSPDFRLT